MCIFIMGRYWLWERGYWLEQVETINVRRNYVIIIRIIKVDAWGQNREGITEEENPFFKYNPFKSDYFNPFEQYKMKLDNNAYLLRNQFPSQKLSKIRELLE